MSPGVIAGVFAGAVLISSGVLKLRSRRWAVAAAEMGTPRPVIVTLPTLEALLGLTLLLQLAKPWAGLAAAALFLAFTVVVTVQHMSGDPVPCNCFGGSESSRPIGKRTIVRNAALVVIALVATR